MLDPRLLRERPEAVEEGLRARGASVSLEEYRALDGRRRELSRVGDELKARRNRASEAVAQAKRRGQDAAAAIEESRRLGEEIRPEPADRPLFEREHRPVPLRRLPRTAAEHEPGAPAQLAPARPDAPTSAHSQMAPEHDAALEPQEQMLADRLHPLEHAAVDDATYPRRGTLRMRAFRLDPLADERLQPRGRAMQRVSLRHQASNALSSSSSAAKIDSENVGYGWIVSRRTSRGVCARTASVSWPSHSPASGPTATAPTSTRRSGSAASLTRPGRRGRRSRGRRSRRRRRGCAAG